MRWIALLLVELLLISSYATKASAEEVCIFNSAVYSAGFQGCFNHVELECSGNNDWDVRGTCDSDDIPEGQETGDLPGAMDGELCLNVGYYSPEAEACFEGHYQQCEASGNWIERNPPEDMVCD